ncbi:asparagine--tRNA ligase [Texas Phoenix palm phytoplasma]|uniref:Asparagine--tRNA ligase n=1 Tax=Texas Phoenix palm phytoplasma TaxID=176709 RepID=A0ABS5BJ16_9MOLU|nr:asparagine--tRNA ligase [Texas Phoenix palm phytoplasma]MBP3059336.1 asparagine--tRNA ligase [Texas Phoenix palm phytoplasma]
MCLLYSVKEINFKYDYLKNKEEKIRVNGWIKNCRFQKNIFFIDLNDGSFIEDLQVVYKNNYKNEIDLKKMKENLQIGSAICAEGVLVSNVKIKNNFELLSSKIIFFEKNITDYPIQPKNHSKSFLRQVAHLRLRTKLFGAVFRIRNSVSFSIHEFFQKEGFLYAHTPIITSSDGEGAGELFKVTTLDLSKITLNDDKTVNFKKDFFAQPTFLTVTGQLEGEAFAMAFSKIYTFGPTFRAENSNTPRHISEFWMIEPEMAFLDLQQNMIVAQNLIQYVIKFCLKNNKKDLEFLEQTQENNLINKLEETAYLPKFLQIKYKKAIQILLDSKINFEKKPVYGEDLSLEHEKFLTEVYFKQPIFVIDWPKKIKAFYMKNNLDNETVAAMDLLFPKVGELIGGSQREEKLEVLKEKMKEFNISFKELQWYLDLRRFGSCVHSGFGMGLERFLVYLTGLDNIKDVIAFPRTPKNALF